MLSTFFLHGGEPLQCVARVVVASWVTPGVQTRGVCVGLDSRLPSVPSVVCIKRFSPLKVGSYGFCCSGALGQRLGGSGYNPRCWGVWVEDVKPASPVSESQNVRQKVYDRWPDRLRRLLVGLCHFVVVSCLKIVVSLKNGVSCICFVNLVVLCFSFFSCHLGG